MAMIGYISYLNTVESSIVEIAHNYKMRSPHLHARLALDEGSAAGGREYTTAHRREAIDK
jgi:hypothetical protein